MSLITFPKREFCLKTEPLNLQPLFCKALLSDTGKSGSQILVYSGALP
ncbi:hypothetical protein MNBD_GAMMA25-128 [hydrothermal vent metagenome]|uniref:Uncharacterized protein n=1 Tax=hydrothermal vent metagenome TaxID=652676 RepID=A0A3B1BWS2_9ZZZZ